MSFEFKLSQAEIDKAIKAHVATLGLNTVGKQLSVDFTTTRKGGSGYSAVVTISDSAPLESTHLLDNATTAQANAARVDVIKQTGTDALGHAAENKAEIPSAPSAPAEEVPVVPASNTDEESVDLPPPVPETAGHESTDSKKSLFD